MGSSPSLLAGLEELLHAGVNGCPSRCCFWILLGYPIPVLLGHRIHYCRHTAVQVGAVELVAVALLVHRQSRYRAQDLVRALVERNHGAGWCTAGICPCRVIWDDWMPSGFLKTFQRGDRDLLMSTSLYQFRLAAVL